jgi:hypothetical protein
VISGRREMTEPMQKIRSIGQNIEWWDVHEVQILGTKIERERAFLDTLDVHFVNPVPVRFSSINV